MELTIKHTHMTHLETHTYDAFGPESKNLTDLHLSEFIIAELYSVNKFQRSVAKEKQSN